MTNIKEEVERLNDAIDNETSPNAKSFLLGKKAGVIETNQKMIEEFKKLLKNEHNSREDILKQVEKAK